MRFQLAAWLILVPATASAQTTGADPVAPSAQGEVSATIYANDIGLIQDTRRIALPAGRSVQAFPDVSAKIKPETVGLVGAGVSVVEQNFDYDLLSPSSLMEKAVGETITIVRTNPGTGAETRERAKVLAVNGGVVLQTGDRIEVLRDDGLPVRAIFDKVPPTLRARPTLSVTVSADRGGERPVALSYLTTGLGWSADYVALFDQAAGKIDVQGWVTLSNATGTTFNAARTLLVAGEVGTNDEDSPSYGRIRPPRSPRPIVAVGTETAAREQLGDFYVYPLAERTTIADKQTKQVSFLDVKGAAAASGYEYRNAWLHSSEQPESAASVLRFSNAAKGGLGDALPAGTVRVYTRDARGQAQFVGENAIPHTPQGSSLSLKTGDAFDVKVQPTVVSRERLAPTRWRTTMRYALTNARAAPVTVDLVQSGIAWWFADTRLVSESLKSRRVDADAMQWSVPVPANGSAEVTASFETRF